MPPWVDFKFSVRGLLLLNHFRIFISGTSDAGTSWNFSRLQFLREMREFREVPPSEFTGGSCIEVQRIFAAGQIFCPDNPDRRQFRGQLVHCLIDPRDMCKNFFSIKTPQFSE